MKGSEMYVNVIIKLAYNFLQDEFEGDSWGNVVASLKSKKKAEEFQDSAGQNGNTYDRNLLLGGCVDGAIVVFDWQNESSPGKLSFKIEVQ